MSETIRLWSELSGIEVRQLRPMGDKTLVNGTYLVWQDGADIHQERRHEIQTDGNREREADLE